jgi:alpha-beta hydrolase superfamily lysophospholipase
VEPGSDRGVILLIPGLWFRPSVWTPWLAELDEAGYDAAVLPWSGKDQAPAGGTAAEPGFDALLNAARNRAGAFTSRPIVIGHGVGAVVGERLLNDGDAAAAISLAPVPGGYPAVPAAARLFRRETPLALLGLRGAAVAPTLPQFSRAIASASSDADAQKSYEKYVAAGKPRDVLLHAVRHRAPARSRRPRRGPLLLVAGGKDELIREMSVASLHRDYRRRQPGAITDYQVFPDMDHTLGLGTPEVVVLFYCLDWLTAQNM